DDVFAVAGNFKRQKRKVFTDIIQTFSHESLNRENRISGILDQPGLRRITHQNIAVFFKVYDGWNQLVPVLPRKNPRSSVFDDGDQTVCRAEIDTNNPGHLTGILQI